MANGRLTANRPGSLAPGQTQLSNRQRYSRCHSEPEKFWRQLTPPPGLGCRFCPRDLEASTNKKSSVSYRAKAKTVCACSRAPASASREKARRVFCRSRIAWNLRCTACSPALWTHQEPGVIEQQRAGLQSVRRTPWAANKSIPRNSPAGAPWLRDTLRLYRVYRLASPGDPRGRVLPLIVLGRSRQKTMDRHMLSRE